MSVDWDALYTILVEECRASEDLRADFLYTAKTGRLKEFRFRGALGLGGKLRSAPLARGERLIWVEYYPADHTAERDKMIDAAYTRILTLVRAAQEAA